MNGAKRDSLYQNKVIYDFINDDKAIIKSILDYLSECQMPILFKYLMSLFHFNPLKKFNGFIIFT